MSDATSTLDDEALGALLEAVEQVLEACEYPSVMDRSHPVCHVHPDALAALEDAYDQLMDQLVDSVAFPEEPEEEVLDE